MIAEALEDGKKRVKLYTDEKGNFKGDALIIYYRPESVDLAISMLDDSEFRFGAKGPQGNMRVQVADSSYKKQKEEDKKQNFESRTHYDREKFAKKLKRHKERMEKYAARPAILGAVMLTWGQEDRRMEQRGRRGAHTLGKECGVEAHVHLGGAGGTNPTHSHRPID